MPKCYFDANIHWDYNKGKTTEVSAFLYRPELSWVKTNKRKRKENCVTAAAISHGHFQEGHPWPEK